MLCVNRSQLIAWYCGTLLDFEDGKGLIVDEFLCKEADEVLERGETVYLTKNGRVISLLKKKNDKIIEEPYEED